jgi:hypothetical protein
MPGFIECPTCGGHETIFSGLKSGQFDLKRNFGTSFKTKDQRLRAKGSRFKGLK